MLHERVNVAPLFIVIIAFTALVGLIIGAAFFAPKPSVGEPVPEKTQLFDKPLKKGVENLIWQS